MKASMGIVGSVGFAAIAFLATIGGLAAGPASLDPLPECDLGSYRLPPNIIPTHYNLTLHPELKSSSIDGDVQIHLHVPNAASVLKQASKMFGQALLKLFTCSFQVTDNDSPPDYPSCDKCDISSSKKTNRIVLHADSSIKLNALSYFESESDLTKNNRAEVVSVCRDTRRQLIGITLGKNLRTGSRGVLRMRFKSQIRDDFRGVYRSTHKDETTNEVREFVVSQLQTVDARLAFPCFDEPSFKASINLKLISEPEKVVRASTNLLEEHVQMTRVGDEIVERKVSSFEPSDPMTIHLLGFTIGDYEHLEQITERGDTTVRVNTVPGRRDSATFALETAVRALQKMEEFMGFQYPLKKLDIIAIPDHDKGNAENWGIPTIRDALVLIDEDTTEDRKITAAIQVVHVIVHQWFANMVTMGWWTETWVTEGIAAMKSLEIVRELYPHFSSDALIRISLLNEIMHLDSSGTQHALAQVKLEKPKEIYDSYDNLTFMKGASLMQMLHDFVGKEVFAKTLQEFGVSFKFSSAMSADFLKILERNSNNPEVMSLIDTFVKVPGVPIVNVEARGNNQVALHTESFRHARESMDSSFTTVKVGEPHWTIPVTMFFSDGNRRSASFPVVVRATDEETLARAPEWFDASNPKHWLKLNPYPNLSTYYRVRYSDVLLNNMKNPVESKSMAVLDRMNILEDVTYLSLGGKMRGNLLLEVINWFASEDEPLVLLDLLVAFKIKAALKLQSSQPVASPFGAALQKFGLNEVDGEDMILRRVRATILKVLIGQGSEKVVDGALELFAATKGEVPLSLRAPVYDAVVLKGDSTQVEQLVKKLHETHSYQAQLTLAKSLAASKDDYVLQQLFDWLRNSNFKAEVRLSIVKTMESSEAGKSIVAANQIEVEKWRAEPKPTIPTPE